eukprot:192684_1
MFNNHSPIVCEGSNSTDLTSELAATSLSDPSIIKSEIFKKCSSNHVLNGAVLTEKTSSKPSTPNTSNGRGVTNVFRQAVYASQPDPLPIGTKCWCYGRVAGQPDVKLRCQIVEKRKREGPRYQYYVHYDKCDRRMDQWIERAQLSFEPFAESDQESDEEDSVDDHHPKEFSEEDLKHFEEHTRIKNINQIFIGNNIMEAWYFSPFPAEFWGIDTVYFCEFCLSFYCRKSELERHLTKCTLFHPPGDEIYRSREQNCLISVFEVDGSVEITYSQKLCYLAKLFLDHKTLIYDTSPFLFYILCEVDETGCHLLGYFSKEKYSEENYNVACILTLPCYQRMGLGKFLISLSYELSRIEGLVCTPERPLSDLGQVSYERFWAQLVLQILSDQSEDSSMSISELSSMTGFKRDDISAVLKKFSILHYLNGEHVLRVPPDLYAKHFPDRKIDPTVKFIRPCIPSKLHWTAFIRQKQNTQTQSV